MYLGIISAVETLKKYKHSFEFLLHTIVLRMFSFQLTETSKTYHMHNHL